MKTFTQITDKMCRYISYLSMAGAAFLMVYMSLDVILRHVFNSPIKGGYEISTLVMCVLIFTSWSYTQTVHRHIHVTMFIGMMPQIPRFICFGFTSILSTVVLGFATYATVLQTLYFYKKGTCTGMLLVPQWPFVLIECASLACFTVILLRDAIKAVLAIGSDAYAEEIQALWD